MSMTKKLPTNSLKNKNKYFTKNYLTGEKGLYAPKKYNNKIKRPLPLIKEQQTRKTCNICKENKKHSKKQKNILNYPNPNPLSRYHYMITWKNHATKPTKVKTKTWEQVLKIIHSNLEKNKNITAYGNLGENSGASEKHLHMHTLKTPKYTLEKNLKRKKCVLCRNKLPVIDENKKIKIAYVEGGRHGEIIVYITKHGKNRLNKKESKHTKNIAKMLTTIFKKYNKAGIGSFKTVWHNQKHYHIHIYPSYSAEGGLEASGVSVNRFSKKQVEKILKTTKDKK